MKRDVLGENGRYQVLIRLFRNPGALIVLNIETTLAGLNEVQAILDSFKVFHN